jgi:hypothetical protein
MVLPSISTDLPRIITVRQLFRPLVNNIWYALCGHSTFTSETATERLSKERERECEEKYSDKGSEAKIVKRW